MMVTMLWKYRGFYTSDDSVGLLTPHVAPPPCCAPPGGSYAEFVVVEEPLALRLPPTFPLQLAASIPEAWLTAYQLLFFVAHVKPGQRVLIHAGARYPPLPC